MNFVLFKKSFCFFAIAILITIFSINVTQAKTHDVNVSNSKFTPKDITINVGDTLKWTNTQGSHNVNGTTATYPNNPSSLGNTVGTGWVYTFVFMIPGTYDYQCDPHVNFGMVGTVTVETASDVNEQILSDNNTLNIFPNPAIETITVSGLQLMSNTNPVRIYNNLGVNVFNVKVSNNTINISSLSAGVYYLVIGNKTSTFTKLD